MYYQRHTFVCTNERPEGHKRGSCARRGGEEIRNVMKSLAKELGLKGEVRINSAGCLDRCELGPVVVVYPEGTWYRVPDRKAAERIVREHLLKGKVVPEYQLADTDK
jgi:(2Fe-2S) ferredoxin